MNRIARLESEHVTQMVRFIGRQDDARVAVAGGGSMEARCGHADIVAGSEDPASTCEHPALSTKHPAPAAILVRAMVFRGQTLGKYRIHRDAGQRRIRHGLSGRRHVDRQARRTEGPAPAEPRLRRAAARAAAARLAQSPQHRHGHHGGEAGQRLLHRHGVRAGRDAGAHRRDAGARSIWRRARLHLPDCSTPSSTRTSRA